MEGSQTFTVILEGGSPWGFSIQGGVDHRSPLRVGKVTPGGRASKAGLVAGDYIIFINSEDSKKLKHLQAQQIIKKSVDSVTLVCTKVRPGVTSPAVSSSSSFTFPRTNVSQVATPPREPVIKAQPISRPKPPQAPAHARSASMGTSSECTTTGSSSPRSNVDVYDIKYQGMDVVCMDLSHPQENGNVNHQQGVDLTCIDRSHPIQNGDDRGQYKDEHQRDVNANTVQQQSTCSPGKVSIDGDKMAIPLAIQFNRLTKDALASAINKAAAERVRRESSGEREDSIDSTNDVSPTQVPITEEPVLQVEQAEQPLLYHVGVPVNEVEEPVSQVKQAEQPMMYQLDDDYPVEKTPLTESVVTPEETTVTVIEEPVSQVEQVEQPLMYQFDESVAPGGTLVVEEPVSQVEQAEHQPLRYTFAETKSTNQSEESEVTTHTSKEEPYEPVIKEEEPVAMVNKDQGWYKQMFQQFQNTVEEQLPGAVSQSNNSPEDPEYVYDHRGLKVRKGSLSRVKQEDLEIDEERKKKNPTPDEEPVYTYDHRGLRVRASSVGKAQDSASTAKNPTISQIKKDTRPKSASASTNKPDVLSGSTTEDVLSLNRRATSYKSEHYDTGASRDYWREKDKDHQEWDKKRRLSQEYTSPQHQRSYSGGEYVDNMTHMHPLLRDAAQESSTKDVLPGDDQPKLFERIDASKLQGALSNATVMGQLEQEGVPSHLLPAVVQAQNDAVAEAAAKKKEKPPPGPKAKALFDFDAQSAKELSFKKGDFLDLVHTVNDNWLEAKLGDVKGIIPRNYVKVLTLQQYREMISPAPPKPTQLAKALFDFQGQSDKELSFKKGDDLHIEKKIDANWYEGFHDDTKGIFPAAYVQITEGSS